MFDTKLTKGPGPWDGDKAKWRHWCAKVEGYIAALEPAMHGLMEIAQQQRDPISHDGLQPEHIELSTKLFAVLQSLMEGDAFEMVMNCPRGNGLEVWRRAHREMTPQAPGTTRTRLMWLVKPEGLTGTWRHRVYVGEWHEREFVATGQPALNEQLRMGVLQAYLSPDEVRTHLLLNASKFATYQSMKEEIESWEEAQRGQEPIPMDVGAIDAPGLRNRAWRGKGA